MFTAKLINKEEEGAAIKFTVEFSDGETTVTEWCIPQNEEGFNHWIKSRIETFNSNKEIKSKIEIGSLIDVDQLNTQPELDAFSLEKKNWFENYAKYQRVLTGMVQTGFISAEDEQVINLFNLVKNGYKPEYFELL